MVKWVKKLKKYIYADLIPYHYLVKSRKQLTTYSKVINSIFLCSLALGLNGRPPRPIGALGSSKIYRVSGDTVLCYPLIFSGEYSFLFFQLTFSRNEIFLLVFVHT